MEHGVDGAVILDRQLDGAAHGRRVDVDATDDVLDGEGGEHLGVVSRPVAVDAQLEAGHVLPLLAQDGDDIHARAAAQADEQQFHRAGPLPLARLRLAVHVDDHAAGGNGHKVRSIL